MNWWHNGFGKKKFRAGTGIRSQLNDELFNCTSTKEDLGTDTPSKTEPVEVKGSVVVTEYKPIPDLEYLQVKNLIEKPQYDHLPLIEASRLCNMDIISKVQQVICLAFHDSKLIMETCPVEMVPLYQIDYFDS